MNSDYDWRQHWQPTLRNSKHTVVELFLLNKPLMCGETLIGVYADAAGDCFASRWHSNGKFRMDAADHYLDLMPVEKPQTYRPFRPDEAAKLITRIVKHVVLGDLSAIYGYSKLRNTYYTAVGPGATAEELLACYVFADCCEDDGQPVGVLE